MEKIYAATTKILQKSLSSSSFFVFCSEASLVRIETGLATGVGMGDTGKREGVDEKLEGLSSLVITSFPSSSIGMNACSTEFLLGNDNFGKANPSNGLSLELLLSSVLSDGLVERGLQNKNMVPLTEYNISVSYTHLTLPTKA